MQRVLREGKYWVSEVLYSHPAIVHTEGSLPQQVHCQENCPYVCRQLAPSCYSDPSSNVTSVEVPLTCICEVITHH